MTPEQLRAEAEKRYSSPTDTSTFYKICEYQRVAFIAGAEWATNQKQSCRHTETIVTLDDFRKCIDCGAIIDHA